MSELFSRIFNVCESIYRAQGTLLPFLGVGLGFLSAAGTSELLDLYKRFDSDRKRRKSRKRKTQNGEDATPEAALEALPKIQPLNCAKCGAGVLLGETETHCPSCGTRGTVPEDYRQAALLKAQAAREIRRASLHWRVARALSHPAPGAIFFWLVFVELGVLATIALGSFYFGWDPAFSIRAPDFRPRALWWWCLLTMPLWTMIFINLTQQSKQYRGRGKTLSTLMPFLDAKDAKAEAANCQDCGGAIAYTAGDFASMCRYCNLVNYRARFVRFARDRAETVETRAGFSLFKARQINDSFVMDAFALIAVWGFGAGVVALFLAID